MRISCKTQVGTNQSRQQPSRKQTRRRSLLALVAASVLTLGLSGCASTNSHNFAASDANPISFMLDWTPNTNHVGIYVANSKGYYQDSGITVKILPTAQAGAETSVENGVADIGFSKLSNLADFNAKGAHLKLVFNLAQQPIARWCSLASRTDITSPKDFDGKTFVSFGSAEQTAVVKQMIKYAGGKGDFTTVTSGTNTFTTLTSGKGDFAGFYVSWEGVQSDLQGPKLNCFTQSDWGVPGNPDQTGFAVKDSWLKDPQHKENLTKFIQATKRGYDWALAHPDEAADILVSQTPTAHIDPQQARTSMKLITQEGYWTNQPKQTTVPGRLNMQDAQTYLNFQYEAGSYQDSKGKPVKQAPQAHNLWTDEFIR
ncbi:ABC transporter substrate-binding protein [Bombiscardovia coagulans]|uniref:Thiamine pyrimidine synthase n=1 Tax=Bombiscardovia coagulans TaxID=686666 RepID=A0A261EV25_9BIFI|nr:ABC transporter substrate-binding protein [Bombiscardovia coagulans]OZG50709.1 Solute binding protein of ABC transporter system [Bombiscardovia coagulans]